MKCIYTAPKLVKKMFPQFLWATVNNQILLTFDDGPNPETTEIILKQLSLRNIKAVFFFVGENVVKYGSLVNDVIKEGHTIGNHTFSHQRIWGLSECKIIENLTKFNSSIEEKFEQKVEYFRPPHGQFDFTLPKALKKTNMKNVMWNLLTRDYKNDLNIVKFGVTNYLQNNSIVVLHDSNKNKQIITDSLNIIFDTADEKGFKFGVPAECLT